MEKNTAKSEAPMEIWARGLTRLGLAKLAAAMIDSFGMLNILFAQLLYLGQPMLEGWLAADRIQSLAGLLEDEEQSAAFSALLRDRKL